MKVYTETGSVYEFNDDYSQVRRLGTHNLRRDEEWLRLLTTPVVGEGSSMVLVLEPLGKGDVTVRTTSPVRKVEG